MSLTFTRSDEAQLAVWRAQARHAIDHFDESLEAFGARDTAAWLRIVLAKLEGVLDRELPVGGVVIWHCAGCGRVYGGAATPDHRCAACAGSEAAK